MNTHSISFIPRHSEVDPEARLKIRPVFDYLQEAAAQHADLLGCGMRFLQTSRKIWVLSRMQLRILRPMLLGEPLTLETYPRGFDKLFALRPLVIRDKEGLNVVEAMSAWLLLDVDKMRILRPAENLNCPLPDNDALPAFFATPEKPAVPNDLPTDPIFSATIADAQIDLNRHLNNAEYAFYTHNALAKLLGHAPQIQEITVNYAKATKLDETIYWFAKINPDSTFFVDARGATGDERFQAAGTLFDFQK